MMKIVFTADNNKEIKVIPVIIERPKIGRQQNNQEVDTLNGPISIIGKIGLREINFNSFFPNYEYKWIPQDASADGWSYVNFFEKWQLKLRPIRIIILKNDGSQILNMPCTIDSFSYSINKNGNIDYNLSVKEYVFVNTIDRGGELYERL